VKQAAGVGATLVWSGVLTFVIIKVVDGMIGIRVSDEEETTGLDLSLHNEQGFNL
jgi:Amt family ammonium transporter